MDKQPEEKRTENQDQGYLEKQITDPNIPTSELSEAKNRIDELQDFVIWMTGCGYDFCQHEYFCKMRDKLLK